MSNILVVDDEERPRKSVKITLENLGYRIIEAENELDALNKVKNEYIEVMITDMQMPRYPNGDIDERCGLSLLNKVKKLSNINIIIMTAYGSIENAVEAIKMGAFDYLTKPFSKDELKTKVERALNQKKILNENMYLRDQMKNYTGTIIGKSSAIKDIWTAIDEVAITDVPVLIRGESGVGKELVARAIHESSRRRNQIFVPINLSALPETLIESELFGHEKGAFTGALSRKIGKFELATDGTLFLDEIGEINMNIQIKLLRVLQEQRFERIGGDTSITTDTRIIAATNTNLEEKIRNGCFREDLFFRLNVFPIYIPPLRNRKEDIPELVTHFINKYRNRISKSIEEITPEALKILIKYDWPGNIRELENIVQRMMIKATGNILDVDDIPREIISPLRLYNFEQAVDTLFDTFNPQMGKSLWDVTLSTLAKLALNRTKKKSAAAELLGISKPTLYHWLKDNN
jgi:DNA-binding NtrC family response regulator